MESSSLKYNQEEVQGLPGVVTVVASFDKEGYVTVKLDAKNTSMADMLQVKDAIENSFVDILTKYIEEQKRRKDENK